MADLVELSARDSKIDGLQIITMKQVSDDRGTVREFYRGSAFEALGFGHLGPWAQVNVTETRQGALRGMHAEAMDKLVAVVAGEAFGAWVDLRPGSATRGAVVTARLVPGTQVLVPSGVGNGFQATAPGSTQYLYCFTREWSPGMAGTACTPLDPSLGIDWPIAIDPDDPSQISAKDRDAPTLAQLEAGRA